MYIYALILILLHPEDDLIKIPKPGEKKLYILAHIFELFPTNSPRITNMIIVFNIKI